MDIEEIEDWIYDLEHDITPNNVLELASLYIVRQNYKNANTNELDGLEKELNDILPAYRRYCETKRKYQMNETTDEPVLRDLKLVCAEIEDLFSTLYSGTDMRKERKILFNLIDTLHKKYSR